MVYDPSIFEVAVPVPEAHLTDTAPCAIADPVAATPEIVKLDAGGVPDASVLLLPPHPYKASIAEITKAALVVFLRLCIEFPYLLYL
jgi:hypothetical protein